MLKGCLGVLAGFFLLVLLVTCLGHQASKDSGVRPDGVAAASSAATDSDEGSAATPATAWSYDEEKDPMRDAVTKTACVSSSNVVVLQPPYSTQRARLCIRRGPKYGLQAFVYLPEGGQLICDISYGCPTKVRFDAAGIRQYRGRTAADYSSDMIFVTPASGFVAGLRHAKVTRLEITLYEAGSQTVEFPTDGLVWAEPGGAAKRRARH